MIPAYFPFTYISEKTTYKIFQTLGKFFVYKPSQKSSLYLKSHTNNKELTEIRIPITNREEDLKKTLTIYTNWLLDNSKTKKIDTNLMKSISKKIPFYNDESIRSIKQKIINNKLEKNTEKLLFNIRLFLILAENNDFQSYQSEIELKKVKRKERILKQILQNNSKKEINNTSEKFLYEKNKKVFMCSERIKAWTTIVLKDKIMPDFLITSNYSVINSLYKMKLSTNLIKVSSLPLSFDKKDYKNNLKLIKNITKKIDIINSFKNINHSKPKKNLITLYVFPNLSLKSFFKKTAYEETELKNLKQNNNIIDNTIIAYIS